MAVDDRRGDDLLRGPRATSFSTRLDRWVADARIDEAALGRARERWLREVADQEATFGGVLIDLAERAAPVVIHVRGGRRLHGTIRAIGADFAAVELTTGAAVLVATKAITQLRTAPQVPSTVGDRVVRTELRLADVLSELAADRERIAVVTRGGDTIAGELRSVGQDVVVLRTQATEPAAAYVPLGTIDEVLIG